MEQTHPPFSRILFYSARQDDERIDRQRSRLIYTKRGQRYV